MSTAIVGSASRQKLRELRARINPVLHRQIDGRGTQVNIPARTIALCLAVYFLHEEVTSLLDLDHKLRDSKSQRLVGLQPYQRSENAPIASDSTIRSALEGWGPNLIREFSIWLYQTLEEKNLLGLTLPSGLNLNVGVVDSSSFGNCYCNCIMAVADTNTFALDLEAHEQFKRGKELSAARRLLQRWQHRFELLLFDGLYLNERSFDQLKSSLSADFLIKYPIKPDRQKGFPWPLSQAEHAIKKGLRQTTRIDDERFGKDESVRCHRVSFRDQGHQLIVDKFRVDAEGKEDLFAVTSRTDLSADDTWRLCRERWSIESRGFRSLSLQNDSKDQHPEGGPKLPPAVKYTLLFWLLLFQSFVRMLEAECVSADEKKNVKVTESWLIRCVMKYVEALFNGPRGDP